MSSNDIGEIKKALSDRMMYILAGRTGLVKNEYTSDEDRKESYTKEEINNRVIMAASTAVSEVYSEFYGKKRDGNEVIEERALLMASLQDIAIVSFVERFIAGTSSAIDPDKMAEAIKSRIGDDRLIEVILLEISGELYDGVIDSIYGFIIRNLPVSLRPTGQPTKTEMLQIMQNAASAEAASPAVLACTLAAIALHLKALEVVINGEIGRAQERSTSELVTNGDAKKEHRIADGQEHKITERVDHEAVAPIAPVYGAPQMIEKMQPEGMAERHSTETHGIQPPAQAAPEPAPTYHESRPIASHTTSTKTHKSGEDTFVDAGIEFEKTIEKKRLQGAVQEKEIDALQSMAEDEMLSYEDEEENDVLPTHEDAVQNGHNMPSSVTSAVQQSTVQDNWHDYRYDIQPGRVRAGDKVIIGVPVLPAVPLNNPLRRAFPNYYNNRDKREAAAAAPVRYVRSDDRPSSVLSGSGSAIVGGGANEPDRGR